MGARSRRHKILPTPLLTSNVVGVKAVAKREKFLRVRLVDCNKHCNVIDIPMTYPSSYVIIF